MLLARSFDIISLILHIFVQQLHQSGIGVIHRNVSILYLTGGDLGEVKLLMNILGSKFMQFGHNKIRFHSYL